MSDLWVDMGAVAAFGTAAIGHGAELAAAGAVVAATGPELLAPVFGAVGAEFVIAFGGVHAGHVDAITRLAAIYHGMGTAAATNAGDYAGTDQTTATSLDGAR